MTDEQIRCRNCGTWHVKGECALSSNPLVQRLREMRGHHPEIAPAIVLEAADEIERLSKIVNDHCQPPTTALAMAYADIDRLTQENSGWSDLVDRQAKQYAAAAAELERLQREIERREEALQQANRVHGAEYDELAAECERLREALGELIPLAENEYPQGDHPAVGRARDLLRGADETSAHRPGCWKLQSPSGQGVCNCGAEASQT